MSRWPASSLEEKIWTRIVTVDDCWEWTGDTDVRGYGRVMAGGKRILAHRAAYELFVGPVPKGTELDHLCRNRRCVKPDHLEAVPHRLNVLRGVGPVAEHAKQTHCLRGHPLSGDNLRFIPRRGGERVCKACGDIRRSRRRNQSIKEVR